MDLLPLLPHTIPIQNIHAQIDVLRLDTIHPHISGNKYFKLIHACTSIKKDNYEGLLTFGGYYSNHIAAAAALGASLQIHTIGVINGLAIQPLNPTLQQAVAHGMQLLYSQRLPFHAQSDSQHIAHWQTKYPNHYIVPAGGANWQGIQGCLQILPLVANSHVYSHIACSVGTGTTLIGLANSASLGQQVVGFAPFKKDVQLEQFVQAHAIKNNYTINYNYHMGGFSKFPAEVLQFIETMQAQHKLPLDKVYTAKMLMGIYHMLEQGLWSNKDRILMIHSGGLQGN